MKILALDVAVSGCAVAIYDVQTANLIIEQVDTERGQAEMLVPMIDAIIKKSGLTLRDISRIAVTCGPGSFTGVRIGLTTARTLGMALNKPVFGMSTLDLLSKSTDADLVIIDTKRGDFYGQVKGEQPRIWSQDEVNSFNGLIAQDAMPDVGLLARIAGDVHLPENFVTAEAPQPVYLRGAEVSQPKNKTVFQT